MTLVLALRCRDGVVLAADSQRTEGPLRETVPKLFTSPSGIVWGTAGSIAIQQELYAAMGRLPVTRHPSREDGRTAIVDAVRAAARAATEQIEDATPAALAVEGIFAWYSAADKRTFVIRVRGDGYFEFHPNFVAVGSPAHYARFALNRTTYMEYGKLPLEVAKMLAFRAADDVIRAASTGVGLPVQVAVVTEHGCGVLNDMDVRGLEDTVAAFREHQREYLIGGDEDATAEGDTGLRP
jgi:proteasome beta subunit